MAVNKDHRHLPITTDTQEFLSYNPFADEQQEGPSSTAVAHPYRAVTTDALFNRNVRSRTQSYNRDASGGHLHPLRSAGLAKGSSDAGITRPHLSRIVKVGNLVDAPPFQSDDTSDVSSLSVPEREVLVHEVDPKDSLAGVSLKYGISMAELRRANHLWTSDSIHFREVLYIPLDKASRSLQSQADYNLMSLVPSEESGDPVDAADDLTVPSTDKESSSSEHHVGTIRRIPVSHLSFFPPSSVKDPIDVSAQSFQQDHVKPSSRRQTHARFASSPSLTSILTALPIAVSTRETIMARLSFDSLSSSDREDTEHLYDGLELDDVGHKLSDKGLADGCNNGHKTQYIHPSIPSSNSHPITEIAQPNASDGDIPHPFVSMKPSKSSTRPWHPGGKHLDSPKAYIPAHPQIRTAQLEPSPEMRLPLSTTGVSRSKGKTSTQESLLDMDLQLEDTENTVSRRTYPAIMHSG